MGVRHFAGAAQFQVPLDDDKTVAGLTHDVQSLAVDLRQRWMVEQHAVASSAVPVNSAAQLIQLGQTKAFGVLDDCQTSAGYVDVGLDHRGHYQQPQHTLLEDFHHHGLVCRFHAPVDQADA